jgi:DNA-binding transcriptional LysR family regulator
MKTIESVKIALPPAESEQFADTTAGKNHQLKDIRNFRISLKQWKMFHAVVDFDGFTGAAGHLHISQSAISYTLAKLQEQLGVTLFKLEGRKAQITQEGKILLNRSRDLVRSAIELETLAQNLREGWMEEIRIMVDQDFPSHLLMLALRKLSPLALSIRLNIEEATMDQIETALYERTADLAIGTQVPLGFVGRDLLGIEYIAVAHPGHPLFALNREITVDDLENNMQIVMSGSSDDIKPHTICYSRRYARIWNVRSFDTAIDAVRQCFGYAWLPRHRVQRYIDQGEMNILPFRNGSSYKMYLHLIYGQTAHSDSGVRAFADVLCDLASIRPVENVSEFL